MRSWNLSSALLISTPLPGRNLMSPRSTMWSPINSSSPSGCSCSPGTSRRTRSSAAASWSVSLAGSYFRICASGGGTTMTVVPSGVSACSSACSTASCCSAGSSCYHLARGAATPAGFSSVSRGFFCEGGTNYAQGNQGEQSVTNEACGCHLPGCYEPDVSAW